MTQAAPGKYYREGLSLIDAVKLFSDEAATEAWFVETRWPDGVVCPGCDSLNVRARPTRKPQPFRCYDCRMDFSVKTGSIMHGSKLPLSTWAIASYLLTTNLKGVSSMKLHRDLGITQKSAWYLAHRIRRTWEADAVPFAGPVEADETYIGGKERNKHERQRLHAGRGPIGKTAVAGAKDRATGRVSAAVVDATDAETLVPFVEDRSAAAATVYTDDARAYRHLDRLHGVVRHGVGEYVYGQAHTNGIESFWSMLKRGYVGTYHQMSPKHLGRYVDEFAGRHNARPLDTVAQMQAIVRGMSGKRLRYREQYRRRYTDGQLPASAGRKSRNRNKMTVQDFVVEGDARRSHETARRDSAPLPGSRSHDPSEEPHRPAPEADAGVHS